jgi:hypothetical protein
MKRAKCPLLVVLPIAEIPAVSVSGGGISVRTVGAIAIGAVAVGPVAVAVIATINAGAISEAPRFTDLAGNTRRAPDTG